ncbi:hypothetical protein RHGRI_021082 [Rhododendron griersonianum]|uniref:DUF4283 domain-containing protein n=1 Tax=Rhododendron griersonianum TaxID=479676 RepID=A0AAV6JJ18_9ERIC|nr:hypothetical protein RHGRI_021082 [Rhododendron griersonianum]
MQPRELCIKPNSYCSASKLGLPNSGVPIILQREDAMIVSDHKNKSLCVPVVHNSLGKVNLFDFLEAATIPHNEHLEILEGDTPTVKQIKNLTKEDEVTVLSPAIEGATVRVSPPKHVETHGAEKWKDCIVGHFVDKKLPYLSVRSTAFRIWGKYGLKDVLSNEKGLFFFQFGAEGAYCQISEVGAWHFAGRMITIGVKYPWRHLRCVACNVFGHSDYNQLAKESIQPTTFMRVPQAKVWAVKSVKTVTEACAIPDILGLQNTPKEPTIAIPCTMTNNENDNNRVRVRKQKSGSQNRKVRQRKDATEKSLVGSISSLFNAKKQKSLLTSQVEEASDEEFGEDDVNDNLGDKDVNEEASGANTGDVHEERMSEDVDVANEESREGYNEGPIPMNENIGNEEHESMLDLEKDVDVNYDPGLWGSINDSKRIMLVL